MHKALGTTSGSWRGGRECVYVGGEDLVSPMTCIQAPTGATEITKSFRRALDSQIVSVPALRYLQSPGDNRTVTHIINKNTHWEDYSQASWGNDRSKM